MRIYKFVYKRDYVKYNMILLVPVTNYWPHTSADNMALIVSNFTIIVVQLIKLYLLLQLL